MSSTVTGTTYPTAANDATEAKLEAWAGSFITNGVIPGVSNLLSVFADSTGMHCKLMSGAMMIGVRGDLSSLTTLDVATADATNPRIDTVVGELTRTPSPYVIKYRVITGTPGVSPVAPTLTNTTTTLQLALADVRVDAGVSTIAAGKVTDRRVFCEPPNHSIAADGLIHKFGTGAKGAVGGYLTLGAIDASNAHITPESSGTDINLLLRSKGNGVIKFQDHSGNDIGQFIKNQGLKIGSAINMGNSQDGVLGLSDIPGALSGNPTNGGYLYSNAGALYWRGSAGTVSLLASA